MVGIDAKEGDSPQRLIAVSLGKIAASRGQRGGPTLRKSLLISTLLHKARSTVMLESYQMMLDAQSDEFEPEIPDDYDEEIATQCPIPEPCVWATPVEVAQDYETLDNQEEEDSEPTYISLQTVSSSKLSTENILQNKDINSQPLSDISCAKCTKRRIADCYESEYDEENDSLDSDSDAYSSCVYSKRLRLDSEACETSENVDSSNTNGQISSLVHRFNSGLSGFLGGHVTACTSGDEDNEQLTSCANQVSKELGALSRTCIALSV